jgi:hypothetical protein
LERADAGWAVGDLTYDCAPLLAASRCATASRGALQTFQRSSLLGNNILNAKVIGTCKERQRSREFVKFLNHLEKQLPAEQEIHLIMDNYYTHKSAEVQRWLKPKKRKRLHFHFTRAAVLG